jgi:hypothetical protein
VERTQRKKKRVRKISERYKEVMGEWRERMERKKGEREG